MRKVSLSVMGRLDMQPGSLTDWAECGELSLEATNGLRRFVGL